MKHCMPPQGPAPTRAKQIPLPLPPPHTPQPWTPSSPHLLRCAFLSITLSCVGARSPSLGAVGAVDPPWLLLLSRFLLLWIQAAARWQRLLGLHCCGGGGRTWVSGGGRAQRGSPGGVWWCLCTLVPGGGGGGMLPCPALPAAGWLHWKGYGAMCGVRAVPWGGGVTPVQPLGSALGLCPPPSRVQPPSRVCPVL